MAFFRSFQAKALTAYISITLFSYNCKRYREILLIVNIPKNTAAKCGGKSVICCILLRKQNKDC
jgi:hypothetical protein